VEALVEVLDPAGGYHPDEQAAESQRADLWESRRLLQERLDTPVDTLAYPNGGRDDYDEATIAAAREVATRMR